MKTRQKIACLALGCAVIVGCRFDGKSRTSGRLVGVWHSVGAQDTIASIAKKYQADPHKIVELNDLTGDGALKTRREIFIPKESGALPGVGYKEIENSKSNVKDKELTHNKSIAEINKAGTPEIGQCNGNDSRCLSWPVRGQVIRPFGNHGNSTHDGVDIAAEDGQAVVASKDGIVIYSGNEISGYGNMVIMRHSDGMITVYAHNKINVVSEGDEIKRNQPIAEVGKTGSAGRPHLHFELRINERTVDPIKYLEGQKRK